MDADLDLVFTALADRSRRALLRRLSYGPATTGHWPNSCRSAAPQCPST